MPAVLDRDDDGYRGLQRDCQAAGRASSAATATTRGPACIPGPPRPATAATTTATARPTTGTRRRGRLRHRSAGVCAAGTRTCVSGALACVRNQAPSAEVCTGGLDEDCDGQGRRRDTDCSRGLSPTATTTATRRAPVAASRPPGRAAATATIATRRTPGCHRGVQRPSTTTATARTTKGTRGGGEACLDRAARALRGGDPDLRGDRAPVSAQRLAAPRVCIGRARRGLRRLQCDADDARLRAALRRRRPRLLRRVHARRLPGRARAVNAATATTPGRRAHPAPSRPATTATTTATARPTREIPAAASCCSTGSRAPAMRGRGTAWAEQLVCVRTATPSRSVCTNGVDDDCDGTQDAADPDCFLPVPMATAITTPICAATCRLAAATSVATATTRAPACIPAATEACNGRDDDCDGSTDEGDPGGARRAIPAGERDLRRGHASLHTLGPELHPQRGTASRRTARMAVDDDCDGHSAMPRTPTAQPPASTRTATDSSPALRAARVPTGAVCGDCDDARASVHPGATETCNGRDDDCEGGQDEGNPGGNASCQTGNPGSAPPVEHPAGSGS